MKTKIRWIVAFALGLIAIFLVDWHTWLAMVALIASHRAWDHRLPL